MRRARSDGVLSLRVVLPLVRRSLKRVTPRNLDALKVTKGESNVATCSRTPSRFRESCKTCGGHLFTDHPPMKLLGV